MKVLDIGCGGNKFPGAIGVDLYRRREVDVISDLSCLPFKSESFDFVYSSHILEHFTNFIPVMDEIYRVCENSARVHIRVPHYSSVHAWGNPTHHRCFNSGTFVFFDASHPEHYGKCDFKVKSVQLIWDTSPSKGFRKLLKPLMSHLVKNPTRCEWLIGGLFGGFSEMRVELVAIK
jgi:ubiquinone/menaquinone biosynthesis C-methylase UbiE